MLESITTGRQRQPRRILLYGVHGIGKSTFGAMAPNPVFIQTEDGLADIDTASFPRCQSYSDIVNQIMALCEEDHNFETLCVDSLDWLEPLVWQEVVNRRPFTEKGASINGIEDYGYGKGYAFAIDIWKELIEGLDTLRRERGMSIILIAHAKVERYENPETDPYDRYSPKLHKHASALFQEWASEVLFATYKVHTKQTDEGFNKTRTRGIGTGDRILRTTERPAHLAKNRLNLPEEMPLDYSEFAKFI